MTDYFRERGLDAAGVRIVDGSGLSRLNRTTADFLCRFLMLLSREQFHEKFLNSLSVVGQNGTAKNMLPSLPKGIEVHVKTGSMDGVKSYAGYINTRSGETLAFAIMVNDYTCTGKEAAEKLNKILLKIATSY